MLVSIVIPCYNSEFTIEKLVDQCTAEFAKWDGYECEMVLVNDYSRDHTFEAITRAAKKYSNVRGVNLAKNFGQHAAIMAGLQYVHGDLVMGMDDDLQNHPAQIQQFLKKAEEGYDVVFGVYKERKFSAFKNFTGAVSQFLLFHLVDRPKDIEMSSFWLARRYVIEEIKNYQGNDAFIQLLFARTTRNMADIEVEHFEKLYLPKRTETFYVLYELFYDPAENFDRIWRCLLPDRICGSAGGSDQKIDGSYDSGRLVVADVHYPYRFRNMLLNDGGYRGICRKIDYDH